MARSARSIPVGTRSGPRLLEFRPHTRVPFPGQATASDDQDRNQVAQPHQDADLVPLLDAGDVVIDGGNSHFEDTRRRGCARRAPAGRDLRPRGAEGYGPLDRRSGARPRRPGPDDHCGARRGLHASFIAAFDQGFRLLAAASGDYGWGLDLPAVVRVWRGGCIIRTELLAEIEGAVGAGSLLGDPAIASRLPSRLIQAQRDFFGGHGFERVDRSGILHGPWRSG